MLTVIVSQKVSHCFIQQSHVETHVERLRAKNITPHIAVNTYVTKTGMVRKTSIDGRTTRHKGYRISQGKRKMIECLFGWGKQHGTMRKTKHRGSLESLPTFCSI